MSNTVDRKKKIHFVVEKCVEDVKQDEKHVLDLLKSIMRPTCLVKAELRPNLFQNGQFGSKMKISRFQLFGFFMPEANAAFSPVGFQNILPS